MHFNRRKSIQTPLIAVSLALAALIATSGAQARDEISKQDPSDPKKAADPVTQKEIKPAFKKGKTEAVSAGAPIGKQKNIVLPPPPELFYINKQGKQAINFMFYEAREFHEGLAAVLIADQWGYIDKEGNVQIGANFDNAGNFSDGLAPVKVKDSWGYIDHTGKMVIKPRFAASENFKNGYAVVQLSKDSPEFPKKSSDQLQSILKDPAMPPLKKAWLAITSSRASGIIDKKGNFVFEPLYSSIHNFSDDLCLAKEGAVSFFLNKKGQLAIKSNWQEAKPFSEGMAAVKIKEKWGFINTAGAIAIKPTFDEVEEFHKGLAAASLNRKWGFINKKGKWEIQPQFDVVWEGFQTGVAVAGKDMCPIENTHADITRIESGFLVNRRSGNAKDFDESTTPLEPGYFAYPDYRFSLIGRDGKPILEKHFEHIGALCDDVRLVRQDGQFGYIDNVGNTVVKPDFKFAEPFGDGLAAVKKGHTKPRLTERNETLLRHAVPALVADPDLIKKDIEICTQVIKLDPTNAQAFRDRGYLLCNLSRFNDSLKDFDQVIKLCSSSSDGYYWRGMANMQLSKYAEAAIDFTNAIEMESSKPQNFYGRSIALKSLKRNELALNDINRAIALYDHPYYRKVRGELLTEIGSQEAALTDLQIGRHAPSVEPWPVGPKTQEDILSQIATLFNKLKTARETKDNHSIIAFHASELADALDDLRRLKYRENKMLELEDLYARALELRREALKEASLGTEDGAAPIIYKSDLSNAVAQMAGWYVKAQEYGKAEKLYDEALQLAKDIDAPIKEADYLADLGKMYAARKQYEKAQDYLKKSLVLTRNPSDALSRVVRGQTLNAYAIVLNHLKITDDAEAKMTEASELLKFGAELAFLPSPPPLPENASGELSYELALQCKSLGLIETSRNYMKKAVERSASSDKVKDRAERFLSIYVPKKSVDLRLTKAFQKARTAENAGDYPNAERFYKECIETAPDFEWPYESLARLYRLQGDLDGAEKQVKKALSINSGYVDGWLELARIDKARGETGKAKTSVDKALSLDPESQLAQFEQQRLTN